MVCYPKPKKILLRPIGELITGDISVGKRRGEEACEEIKRIKTACACFWNGDEESFAEDV
ncbi:hypothetical protein BDAP_001633 [Binucleata daphniae]